MRLVTFTNLFPSSVMPTHGVFVYERMRRVAAATGFAWTVVAPVPAVVRPLRRGIYRAWAQVPDAEVWHGVDVRHPRFRHWPGLSMRRQAAAVLRGARDVVRALAASGPIVLDAHYLWPDGVAAATLAAELGVPCVLTARGSDVNVLAEDPRIARHIADAARGAAACFAVSDALAARFAAVAGLARDRVATVRNGVDLERFSPGDRAAARCELGLAADARIVLGVGRLVAGKGFALAARALHGLEGATLALVGEGPERAAIAAAAPGRVVFLGALPPERVALACRAADVLVLPSEREGWPNVVTEALASGLPVVATRVGGIPQILGGDPPAEALGALVDVGDEAGLRAALARVLAAPRRIEQVRAFAERYGWDEPVALLARTFRRASGEAAA